MASATPAGSFLPGSRWTNESYYGNVGTYFADVNGDGRADAIAVNKDEAVAVRLSIAATATSGPSFARTHTYWTDVPYYGNLGTYFADVNGDGRADAIAVNENQRLAVRLSNGSSFASTHTYWTDVPYYGNVGTYFADVNGDGMADAIAVNKQGGVAVRMSNGSSFASPHKYWTDVPYYGSVGTYFADVTGDGKADAIAVNDDSIAPAGVWVRPSDGSRFVGLPTVPNQPWTSVRYYGSRGTYFADVTGDGKADAIAVNDDSIAPAAVWVRPSDGSRFVGLPDVPNQAWTEGAYFGVYLGRSGTYFADVTGDGKADAIAVNDDAITVRASG
jgi:hypothetical protein